MDIKYIAGLFDAEGSFTIFKNCIMINIVNSHKAVLEEIHKEYGGTFYFDKGKGQSTSSYRLRFGLLNGGPNFLNKIEPYLLIKKEQAQTIQEFLKTDRKNGEEYNNRIKQSRLKLTNENYNLPPEYIAGFTDGEGHITVIKYKRKDRPSPKYMIHSDITNSHIGVLNSIMKRFGGFIHKRKQFVNLQTYSLIFSPNDTIRFLKYILPYLIIKKEEAELVLSFPQSPSRKALTEQQIQEKDEIRNKILALHGSKYKPE